MCNQNYRMQCRGKHFCKAVCCCLQTKWGISKVVTWCVCVFLFLPALFPVIGRCSRAYKSGSLRCRWEVCPSWETPRWGCWRQLVGWGQAQGPGLEGQRNIQGVGSNFNCMQLFCLCIQLIHQIKKMQTTGLDCSIYTFVFGNHLPL